MDHIRIPVPEGLPDDRKADLIGWLTDLARQAASDESVLDQDDAVREQVARRIKDGMADADADRVLDSTEARRRLDAKLGIDRSA